MSSEKLRRLVAIALLLTATAVVYREGSVEAFGLLAILAIGIGLLLGHWLALILGLVPWPVGIGLGLITGRYAFLGDAWEFAAASSVLLGVTGIALGIIIRHVITG